MFDDSGSRAPSSPHSESKDHPTVGLFTYVLGRCARLQCTKPSAEIIASFIILLGNGALVVALFASLARRIVMMYYTPELAKQKPEDVERHMSLLIVFIALEVLSISLFLTGILSGLRWLLTRFCPQSASRCACCPNAPWTRITAAFFGVAILGFFIAEGTMLADMGVRVWLRMPCLRLLTCRICNINIVKLNLALELM